MTTNVETNETGFELDLTRLFKALKKEFWLILIVGVIIAGLAFLYVSLFVEPEYSSEVVLYVNSQSVSINDKTYVSQSEISAARSLVQTYIQILKNEDTLSQIIDITGVKYSAKQLKSMISTTVQSGTEIFSVIVTGPDAEEAQLLADAVSQVLPIRVAEIVEGTSMRTVSGAKVNYNKVAPSTFKYTMIGFGGGLVLAILLVLIRELLDRTIHEDDELFGTLNIPVLSKIPDLYVKQKGNSYYDNGYYSKQNPYYAGKGETSNAPADQTAKKR